MRLTPTEVIIQGDAPEKEHTPSLEGDIEILREITQEVASMSFREKGEPRYIFAQRLIDAKNRCQKKYPDRLEEIELLYDLPHLVDPSGMVALQRKEGEAADQNSGTLVQTMYQYTITHYLVQNAHNREYLEQFQKSLKEIAASRGSAEEFDGYWRGFIGQAATFHILEKGGLKATLAHPLLDVKGVDLQAVRPTQERPIAIQVKHPKALTRTTITPTEVIRYPAVVAKTGQGEVVASADNLEEVAHFEETAASRAQRLGEQVIAISIHIHEDGCDPITGVPRKATLKKCRKRLQELGIIG